MKDRAKEVHVFRNRFGDALVWCMVTFGALYFLIALINNAQEGKQTVLLVIDALLMLGFLAPALRCPWHGVIVSPKQVVVRNIMRTHRVMWGDIERFEIARYDPWPQVGVVVLRNGRRIPMTALQVALATKVAQRSVAELNRQLAAHTAADGALNDARPGVMFRRQA